MTSSHGSHSFHLVDMSPWRLTGLIGAMMLPIGLVKEFEQFNENLILLSLVVIILTMFQWWRDVVREGTYQGFHTLIVMKGNIPFYCFGSSVLHFLFLSFLP